MTTTPKFQNSLIHETSPYLLQHAHNPVDWLPWGEDAFAKARRENKLVLISIGYSSCHWCHVMEKGSFELEATADLMNTHFVCIKVDREERPDIDQLYMAAVHLMTGQGGWPLNCFVLPDKRPVYGGTYFPDNQWRLLLQQLAEAYASDPERTMQYATELAAGLTTAETWAAPQRPVVRADLDAAFIRMQAHADPVEGGGNRAPKFPMPGNSLFLLRYYHLTKNNDCLKQLRLTLDKMAHGGIYDQLGGGFARYSTDSLWKVPHFEKMLYDNAQLVSLYSEAYQLTQDPLYARIVRETLAFIKRDMTSSEGLFYSAIDADSEGEEGKYYVWKKEELIALLGNEFPLFSRLFNVNERGYWEHGNYILLRATNDAAFAAKEGLSDVALADQIKGFKTVLMAARSQRPAPMLDEKVLVSWNALMIKGYVDAYRSLGDASYLQAALEAADVLLKRMLQADGSLLRVFNKGMAKVDGFLDDYACLADALLALYACTFNERWLTTAKSLTDYVLVHFPIQASSGMNYSTSDRHPEVVLRQTETQDNVIPSSNSMMARNLFQLYLYFSEEVYKNQAACMLASVRDQLLEATPWYYNWAILASQMTAAFYEVVIVGAKAESLRKEFHSHYLPNTLMAGTATDEASDLLLLQGRWQAGRTLIYVCRNQACLLPVQTLDAALDLLNT